MGTAVHCVWQTDRLHRSLGGERRRYHFIYILGDWSQGKSVVLCLKKVKGKRETEEDDWDWEGRILFHGHIHSCETWKTTIVLHKYNLCQKKFARGGKKIYFQTLTLWWTLQLLDWIGLGANSVKIKIVTTFETGYVIQKVKV